MKILKQIEIKKIILRKVLSNAHIIDSLGEPVEFKCLIDQIDTNQTNNAIVRVLTFGKMNKGELIIKIQKNSTDQK